MKKFFLFAALAAMTLVACNKPNDDPNDDPNDEKEYVQPIKIDGNFDDWGKIDAAKMATAKCNPDAAKTALKLVKVYADETFVFVYFEWDKEQVQHDGDDVPFHCYVNSDGDAKTGGFDDQFSDACSDVLFEGFLYSGGSIASYDPAVYKWYGDPNGHGWAWNPGSEDEPILAGGSGLCQGAGVEGKYEFLIAREMFPLGKIADNFSIGFDIQQNWSSVGILPNAAVTDDNQGGLAESLKVTTVK